MISIDLLACPSDGLTLGVSGDGWLECAKAHRYPVIEGIPVLLRGDVEHTMPAAAASYRIAHRLAPMDVRVPDLYLDTLGVSESEKESIAAAARGNLLGIDPVVQHIVGATCGRAYMDVIGNLRRYPIPEFPLPPGNGELLVDIGCNWGRWSIAACRKGYRVVGVDPQLGAVLAAQRVARQLNLQISFVCADARYLPFPDLSAATAFSYSVLQHFSVPDCELAVRDIGRILLPGGRALVQMANAFGAVSAYHMSRRRFRNTTGFEVRYYSVRELTRLFEREIGSTRVFADCFFGLGLQESDTDLFSSAGRVAVYMSIAGKKLALLFPPLRFFADSLYVDAIKSAS